MKNSLFKRIFAILLFIFISCNICIPQTNRERILNLQENIKKEELIEIFVKVFGDGVSTCIPVFLISDSYVGNAIIGGDELFSYYKYEILDSAESKTILMKDFYNFTVDLLLKNDTIKLGSKEFYNYKRGWEFQIFSTVDSIINYPKEKKLSLINLAFGEDGIMRKKIDSNSYVYQPGSLILKLFEWGIFMIYTENPPNYQLFDYTMFRNIDKSGEPTDMINDCLISFLDHIKDFQNLYVMTDYYPYNFYFRDNEMDERQIKYITTEELNNKSNAMLLKDGIRVVYLEDIKLENDLLKLKFSESTIIMNKNKQLAKIPPINTGDFTYQYSPITQNWNLIELKYDTY